MIHRILAAAAALALAASPAAAQLPCLDRATTRAAADLVLPAAMGAIANRCGGEFAAQAPTIAANRDRLAGRFRARADAAWPTVRDWVLGTSDSRLGQARSEIGKSESFARAFVTTLLATQVEQGLNERSCAQADTLLEAILPLPDAQVSAIAGALVRVALFDRRLEEGGIRACPR